MNQGPEFMTFSKSNQTNLSNAKINPEQNTSFNFENRNLSDNRIYELQKENEELKKKLKDRQVAMALPAVFLIILIINVGWLLGVKLIIYPKFEESVKLNETMKNEYTNLKSKVNAIVGEE